MKEIKINLYEGCEYHAILKIEDKKGSLTYFWKGKEFNDQFHENFNVEVFSITKRLAEFICFEHNTRLISY